MTENYQPLDLVAIERRARAVWGADGPERLDVALCVGQDIPALVAEVRALRQRVHLPHTVRDAEEDEP